MADTNTTNYEFILPEPGGSDNTWGVKNNSNWEAVDFLLKSFSDLMANISAYTSPIGSIIAHAAETPPTGWLECNGQAVSRQVYHELFTIIGTRFGAGDGSTTFNLPDLRGEFIRGWDHARNVDTGRVFGSWQVDEFKSHTHQMRVQASSGFPNARDGGGQANPASGAYTYPTGGSETRPRNVALMYCIRA